MSFYEPEHLLELPGNRPGLASLVAAQKSLQLCHRPFLEHVAAFLELFPLLDSLHGLLPLDVSGNSAVIEVSFNQSLSVPGIWMDDIPYVEY